MSSILTIWLLISLFYLSYCSALSQLNLRVARSDCAAGVLDLHGTQPRITRIERIKTEQWIAE